MPLFLYFFTTELAQLVCYLIIQYIMCISLFIIHCRYYMIYYIVTQSYCSTWLHVNICPFYGTITSCCFSAPIKCLLVWQSSSVFVAFQNLKLFQSRIILVVMAFSHKICRLNMWTITLHKIGLLLLVKKNVLWWSFDVQPRFWKPLKNLFLISFRKLFIPQSLPILIHFSTLK